MSAYDFQLLIRHLLAHGVRQYPDQEIVYRDTTRLSYAEMGERVACLGNALTRLGVQPGDTIAVMDWDSHRYLECFFAIPMLGCVLQTVNVRLSPEQILYTLNHTGAGVILCHTDFIPVLHEILPHLEGKRRLVLIDEGSSHSDRVEWEGDYESLLRAGDPGHVFHDFPETTIASTFYTTGTTGLPKGVFYNHRQIVLHTLVQQSLQCLTRNDVYMPITPMFHVHAWGMPFVATLQGAKQVYPGRYAPDQLVHLFRTEGVTFSHCVPTIAQMFLSAAEGVDLSRWRLIVGGSQLPRQLARILLDRGVDILAGYGMSETGPLATLATLKPHLRDGGDIELTYRCRAGAPVPFVDVQIQGDNGTMQPHDGVSAGEVVLRAPWLTQGYLHNPEASARLWEGGWLHTGDIGTIDRDGYLQITDRIKDVIKTGGEWVSSLELEDIIALHPSVAEVAVIGVRDPRWGERPLAIVVPRAGVKPDEAALKAHIAERVEQGVISKYAIPDHIVFADAIPKTSVGKLDKKVLRTQYAA